MISASRGRLSFCVKLTIALVLVALADLLFYGVIPGSALGGFALVLAAASVLIQPAAWRDARSRGAFALAILFALVLIDRPSVLGWGLFWTALALAVLSPRVGPGGDALRWAWRLTYMGAVGMIGPAADIVKLTKHVGLRRESFVRALALGSVPVCGTGIFLALFASANPVISHVLTGLRLPELDGPRIAFWLFALVCVWGFLRPRRSRRWFGASVTPARPISGLRVASVELSLIVFNALFAIENGLDLAFLWSGAPLPKGVTLADYAHRGAYPLIASALMAGAFVLIALRPGSVTARSPALRGLVVLWVIQNLFLVASSILRTTDYIAVYSLTRLRLAALLWMGLVAVGLVLICWRLLQGKSASWLINANALAMGAVLAACSVIDLGAVAADWNVHHAREVGGTGAPLDLCYLNILGDAALEPLAELERRPLATGFRDRVESVRTGAFGALAARQANWRSWSWRGQRRLDRAEALAAQGPAYTARPGQRDCDGTLDAPKPAVPSGPDPLTSARPG